MTEVCILLLLVVYVAQPQRRRRFLGKPPPSAATGDLVLRMGPHGQNEALYHPRLSQEPEQASWMDTWERRIVLPDLRKNQALLRDSYVSSGSGAFISFLCRIYAKHIFCKEFGIPPSTLARALNAAETPSRGRCGVSSCADPVAKRVGGIGSTQRATPPFTGGFWMAKITGMFKAIFIKKNSGSSMTLLFFIKVQEPPCPDDRTHSLTMASSSICYRDVGFPRMV
ncbi:hypothetical protein GQ600_7612 [Phytophthora cactorum]|nr:hypothetical protein GQ600_7612 [Phytophthora cactorum]